MKTMLCIMLAASGMFSGCRDNEPAANFGTPEGAILMLEDAYRRKDLMAALAAKDFHTEARLMLMDIGNHLENDPQVLKEVSETLELGFRAEIEPIFPDFIGVKSRFSKREGYGDFQDIVVITEICTYPDDGRSIQKLLVAKSENGWRVLNVIK